MEEEKILELLKKAMGEQAKERRKQQVVYNFNFYGDKMDVGTVTAVRLLARALNASQEPDPPPPALTKVKTV